MGQTSPVLHEPGARYVAGLTGREGRRRFIPADSPALPRDRTPCLNNPDFPDASAAIGRISLPQKIRMIRKIRIFCQIRFIRMNWMVPGLPRWSIDNGPPGATSQPA